MRTTGKVLAPTFLLCAAGFVLLTFAPARAEAEILCKDLLEYYLSINANGYTGWIQWGAPTQNPDGSTSAQGTAQFAGNPPDPVTLTCKGRHLTFTRTRAGVFTQNYSGWMFVGTNLNIAGDFSHNSAERTYGWCGSFEFVGPK